tara:strand:- start:425 stop:646 length:222 start_codon:yes stop_codon:yes gene_type:complete
MKYSKTQVQILLDEFVDLVCPELWLGNYLEIRPEIINFITDLCNDLYVTETGIEPNKVNEWIEKQKNKRQKVN